MSRSYETFRVDGYAEAMAERFEAEQELMQDVMCDDEYYYDLWVTEQAIAEAHDEYAYNAFCVESGSIPKF